MHYNVLKEEPPVTLEGITDKIEGKTASTKDWLEPDHTKIYFENTLEKHSPLKLHLFKSFRHQKWRNVYFTCGNLDAYADVESLHEFLAAYFTEARAA